MGAHTEVVLLKDVDRLGSEGSVVKVKPGFARNYLLPNGLAALATAAELKHLEAIKQVRLAQTQRLKDQAVAMKQKLESRSLTLKLTLGEDGTPFGSVTAHDVLEALRQDGVAIDKHALHLEQSIKALGIYEIPVKLHADVTATMKVWVVKA